MKLIMTKGLSGSGKSTWAKGLLGDGTKRVNKDDLRKMLDNSIWSRKNEKNILQVRDILIIRHLQDGFNVIVDDTNLAPKHEEHLRGIAKDFKAEFGIRDFTDVPIEVCIAQDLMRIDSVGEAVIRKQYNQFLAPKIPQIEHKVGVPTVIICDIDGTLALFGDANPYDRDFSKDRVNQPIQEILLSSRNRIILLSGRSEKYRAVTEKWLEKMVGAVYVDLFMRAEGDVRKDSIIKEEIYRAEIEPNYNVLFVLDDRNQVVDLWRSLGLTCLQVAEGDF